MKKTEIVILRTTPQEKEFIKAKVKEKKCKNVSDLVLSSIIYPEHFDKYRDQDILYQMHKIGVNNNQIARYANQKRDVDLRVLQALQENNKLLEMIFNTYK